MLESRKLVVLLALSLGLTGWLPCMAEPGNAGAPASSVPAAETAIIKPDFIDAATFQGASLSVAPGQTVVVDFGNQSTMSLPGSIVNNGQLFAVSSNPGISTATFSAFNITNQQGAVFSSILPAGGLPGVNSAVGQLNLVLTAIQNVVNAGTITSSGGLSITAGGAIVNALPSGVIGPGPIMQALNNINLQAQSISNQGIIASQLSNINVASMLATDLVVNNARGTLEALNGTINFDSNSLLNRTNLSVSGGDLLAKELNLQSGCGLVDMNVCRVEGVLNVLNASGVSISTQTPSLQIGQLDVHGDPTILNTGDITLHATDTTTGGAPLVVVSGGSIFADAGVRIDSSATTNGGNIIFVAGADFSNNGSVVDILGRSGSGGDISISSLSAFTSAGGNSGGDIFLLALSDTVMGDTGGRIAIDKSVALLSGGGVGGNGSITMGAEHAGSASISAGKIDSSGSTSLGGNIGLGAISFDTSSGPMTIVKSTGMVSNPLYGTAQSGAISIGELTTSGGMVGALAGLEFTSGAISTAGGGVSLTAGDLAPASISASGGSVFASSGKDVISGAVSASSVNIMADRMIVLSTVSAPGGGISLSTSLGRIKTGALFATMLTADSGTSLEIGNVMASAVVNLQSGTTLDSGTIGGGANSVLLQAVSSVNSGFITSSGSISVRSGGSLFVNGLSAGSALGSIELLAGTTIMTNGTINTSGGHFLAQAQGDIVSIPHIHTAGGSAVIIGKQDVNVGNVTTFGGNLAIVAGADFQNNGVTTEIFGDSLQGGAVTISSAYATGGTGGGRVSLISYGGRISASHSIETTNNAIFLVADSGNLNGAIGIKAGSIKAQFGQIFIETGAPIPTKITNSNGVGDFVPPGIVYAYTASSNASVRTNSLSARTIAIAAGRDVEIYGSVTANGNYTREAQVYISAGQTHLPSNVLVAGDMSATGSVGYISVLGLDYTVPQRPTLQVGTVTANGASGGIYLFLDPNHDLLVGAGSGISRTGNLNAGAGTVDIQGPCVQLLGTITGTIVTCALCAGRPTQSAAGSGIGVGLQALTPGLGTFLSHYTSGLDRTGNPTTTVLALEGSRVPIDTRLIDGPRQQFQLTGFQTGNGATIQATSYVPPSPSTERNGGSDREAFAYFFPGKVAAWGNLNIKVMDIDPKNYLLSSVRTVVMRTASEPESQVEQEPEVAREPDKSNKGTGAGGNGIGTNDPSNHSKGSISGSVSASGGRTGIWEMPGIEQWDPFPDSSSRFELGAQAIPDYPGANARYLFDNRGDYVKYMTEKYSYLNSAMRTNALVTGAEWSVNAADAGLTAASIVAAPLKVLRAGGLLEGAMEASRELGSHYKDKTIELFKPNNGTIFDRVDFRLRPESYWRKY